MKNEIEITSEYFSFSYNPITKTIKGHLGNWTNAGWFWEFDNSDCLVAFFHLYRSQVLDEFKEKFENSKLNYYFKDILRIALRDCDYEWLSSFFTGWRREYFNIMEYLDGYADNLRYEFEKGDSEFKNEEDLENFIEKLYDDRFLKEVSEQFKNKLFDIIKSEINPNKIYDINDLFEYIGICWENGNQELMDIINENI